MQPISQRTLDNILRLGVALLAAGSSRRFGATDKLAQPLGDELLGVRAANAVPCDRFAKAWVVTSVSNHPCEEGWVDAGLEPVINQHAARGMGGSAALAAELAAGQHLDGLVIALADMPLVPASHYRALIHKMQFQSDIIASSKDGVRMPPALFGSEHFVALSELEGDVGARALLVDAQSVDCPSEWLADVDTPEALTTLQERFRSPS